MLLTKLAFLFGLEIQDICHSRTYL